MLARKKMSEQNPSPFEKILNKVPPQLSDLYFRRKDTPIK